MWEQDVTAGLQAAARTDSSVGVALGARSYKIVVGSDLIDNAGSLIKPLLPSSRVGIVTDENVAPLYLQRVQASFDRASIAHDVVILPPGEPTKNFSTLKLVCESLLDARIDRSTALVALGGGVIGDITGFAAGVLLRGVPFVQIPTTLLAQVDSSVGGKTGINTAQGKNLIGLFYQPLKVIADVATLETLDRRQLNAGYAEVVKYGLICDPPFFAWLEEHGEALLQGDRAARQSAIMTSCRAKAAIVSADEREAGQRALLNLGHTFGHAFEAETGYSERLLHGEAVAAGMVLAFELSCRLGYCQPQDTVRVRQHLATAGLPTRLQDMDLAQCPARALVEHMFHDKKTKDGQVTFILARGIGKAFICADVPIHEVESLLRDWGAH